MRQRLCLPAVGLALLLALVAGTWPAWATAQAPTDEHTRQLLEKGLSVVEIDKEIGRIQAQQAELGDTLAGLSRQMVVSEAEAAKKREQAGEVLRAYYTGDRGSLLQTLFAFRSLSDLMAVADYYDYLLSRDKQTLDGYRREYAELSQSRQQLTAEQAKLAAMERRLLDQRARVAALQQEIDTAIASSDDAARLRLMLEEMTAYWENVGLYEVRRYFSALASAMRELPDWLKAHDQYMAFAGLTYEITLPEEALNTFLREQNELFEAFAFTFQDGRIVVSGEREGISVEIAGAYGMVESPKPGILFQVESLVFNGLSLPDTTMQALEEEFDLGFYPQLIVPLVRAKSVEIVDGELRVILELDL
ncbi:hypothetical protein IDH44_04375 [Paenibacillus sp. IB182496]|uniref:N-terminal domain of peptidoglycan hydrolase CwlO-containing protein n=1 Tax=Paenibacillus sabuli TaxID=2772509 RepID=A0A927BR63_9BACL|nr:hypothetical protein [Paenibacillus sabuli]MBD2844416.1 hypothetical protein [Paenibacillus sabuli]